MTENNTKKYGFRDNILWIWALTFLLTVASGLLELIPINYTLFSDAYTETFKLYIPFWSIWFVFLIAILCIKPNRYILETLKYRKNGNNIKNLLIGFTAGFVMNGICALTAYLHGDIKLSFSKFEIFPILLMFIAVFIQSSAEELICRGFMYQKILHRYPNPWVAIFVTSLFFMALHLGNDHISFLPLLDIFLTGVLFALMVHYFDSIWMAMACHTTWNFNQNILLGLPNSGEVSSYSIFTLDTKHVTNSFAYNTGFGLEGTIMSVAVMLISISIIVFANKISEGKKSL
ncbi:type II CAAX endopeptidase family protein [Mogibacterium neglectum]|uniref:CPBP family intramembrane glutamic endopeptidase n=1 Tax=Mogibacterium neglectum TaxID=114528 RepID=UPI00272B1EB5|nr:type II CAAX endopeptidase family protein [Mogibacterium neglectum]WLD76447.1 type II CAAX endopeptidase family protein [Mogibacterium neglectum]